MMNDEWMNDDENELIRESTVLCVDDMGNYRNQFNTTTDHKG